MQRVYTIAAYQATTSDGFISVDYAIRLAEVNDLIRQFNNVYNQKPATRNGLYYIEYFYKALLATKYREVLTTIQKQSLGIKTNAYQLRVREIEAGGSDPMTTTPDPTPTTPTVPVPGTGPKPGPSISQPTDYYDIGGFKINKNWAIGGVITLAVLASLGMETKGV